MPGYYAFYVPPGQYQVTASADGYADYTSPILTVVDAPIFHNVGLRHVAERATSIERPGAGPPEEIPSTLVLHQNYPNPFNPSTVIEYELSAPSAVELAVFNELGQQVSILLQELQAAGPHQIRFNAGSLPSGVYFYRLRTKRESVTKRMILMR